MTEHERRDFINLLARGRGLAPVYDEDALAEAEARDRATAPPEPHAMDDDRAHDARERAYWRAQ